MKRVVCVLLMLALIVALCACSGTKTFVCEFCKTEKSGKKYSQKLSGTQATICEQCHKLLKDDFASLLKGEWVCRQSIWGGLTQVSCTLTCYANGSVIFDESDGSDPVELTLVKHTNGYVLEDNIQMTAGVDFVDQDTLNLEYPFVGTMVFQRVSNKPKERTSANAAIKVSATSSPEKSTKYSLNFDTPYFISGSYLLISPSDGKLRFNIRDEYGNEYDPRKLNDVIAVKCDIPDKSLSDSVRFSLGENYISAPEKANVSGEVAIISLVDKKTQDVLDTVTIRYTICYRDGWINEKAYSAPVVTVSDLSTVTRKSAYSIFTHGLAGLEIDNVTYRYKNDQPTNFPGGYYSVKATFYNKTAITFGVTPYDSSGNPVGETKCIGCYSPTTTIARVLFEAGKGVLNIITDPTTMLAQFECETTTVELEIPLGGHFRIETSSENDYISAVNIVDYMFSYNNVFSDILDAASIAGTFANSFEGKTFDVDAFSKAMAKDATLFVTLKNFVQKVYEDDSKAAITDLVTSENINSQRLIQVIKDSFVSFDPYGFVETAVAVSEGTLTKFNPATGMLEVSVNLLTDTDKIVQLTYAIFHEHHTSIRAVMVPATAQ